MKTSSGTRSGRTANKKFGGLTDRQRAFVEHYMMTWSATEAAKRAGYGEHRASTAGNKLLKDPRIRRIVDNRLDKYAMGANEVLARLSDHARGDMSDYLVKTPAGYMVDIERAIQAGKGRLIKKFKSKTRVITEPGDMGSGDEDDGLSILQIDVELELYDAQAALVHLGRHHKLFTDKVDHEHTVNVHVTSDDMDKARREAMEYEQKMLEDTVDGEVISRG